MKLTIFQSDKGDCLLLSGADGRRILVDGGMSASYTEHVAPELTNLHAAGEHLDLAYVSHIDEDHISGVLQLMDDLVAWRVHEFQVDSGNTHHPPPRALRPPEVRAIWHNAFHEQLGKNAGPIEDMLAATAMVLSGGDTAALRARAVERRDLATSERQAVRLSRRVGRNQLNIPLNAEFEGKLMFVRDTTPTVQLGGMSLFVIGPFEEDLDNLRKDWNKWLKKNQEFLDDIARRSREDEDRLRQSELDRILGPALLQARELGRREEVTPPNLASLMLLVEEGGLSILLTGDGHADDIVKGLRHHGKLNAGRIHVNVLKIQHHGSENNLHAEFCRTVTADHYVFCGNGAHRNPDFDVVRTVIASRLNGGAFAPFKLWFNSSAKVSENPENKEHMRALEELVKEAAAQSGGVLSFRFLKQGHSLELQL